MEIEGCVQLCGPCTANTPESTPMTPCEAAQTGTK